MALAPVILVCQELTQTRIRVLGEGGSPSLCPFQCLLVLTRAFIGLGNVEIIVGQGQVALLNRNQRLDITRLTRERFHDA